MKFQWLTNFFVVCFITCNCPSVSISLSVCLVMSFCLYMSFSAVSVCKLLFVCLSVSLDIFVCVCRSLCLFCCLSFCMSVCVCLAMYIFPSVLYVFLCCLPVCLSVWQYLCMYVFLFVALCFCRSVNRNGFDLVLVLFLIKALVIGQAFAILAFAFFIRLQWLSPWSMRTGAGLCGDWIIGCKDRIHGFWWQYSACEVRIPVHGDTVLGSWWQNPRL